MPSPADLALIERLKELHAAASKGDLSARRVVEALKAKAKAGDQDAKRKHNTLAVIHWNRRVGAAMYAKAEKFYHRLLRSEPVAQRRLAEVARAAKQGDPTALKAFRILKSIHHKYKASVWSGPGAPRTGGYGMPNIHRAGIDIPGMIAQYLPLTPQASVNLLMMMRQARAALPPSLLGAYNQYIPQAALPMPIDMGPMPIAAVPQPAAIPGGLGSALASQTAMSAALAKPTSSSTVPRSSILTTVQKARDTGILSSAVKSAILKR